MRTLRPAAVLPGMTADRLPGYTLEEVIATGGSAQVWRGRRLADGTPVAVKQLRLAGNDDGDSLRREVAAQGSIADPHVLPVVDVRMQGETAYIVTPLAAVSVSGLLASRGRLQPGEVITLLAPLARTLAAAHRRLLVHGDISPGNILLDKTGRPLLADFGQSRISASSAEAAAATAGYVDPAVAAGGEPGPACDVFGLAAVGYVALTGRPPWPGERQAALAAARSHRRPSLARLAPLVPARLAAALEDAMQPEPEARPAAAELAEMLLASCPAVAIDLPAATEAATGAVTEPVIAPDPPRHPKSDDGRLERTSRSRAMPVLLVVAATVLIGGAMVAGMAWGRHGPDAAALPPAATNSPRTTAPRGSTTPPTPAPTTDCRSTCPTRTTAPPRGRSDKSPDWGRMLRRFARLRTTALAAVDPSRLRQIYLPGSQALRSDLAAVSRLRSTRLRPHGLHCGMRLLSVAWPGGSVAHLHVLATTSAYRLVDASGRPTVLSPPAAVPSELTLRLRSGGWRIASLVGSR